MPVTGQHVFYPELVQQIHLAGAVGLIDDPVRFGIRRQIVAPEGRNVLDADHNLSDLIASDIALTVVILTVVTLTIVTLTIATLTVGVITLLCLGAVVASSSTVPPVAMTTVVRIRGRRLMSEPGKHLFRFGFRLRRQRLR